MSNVSRHISAILLTTVLATTALPALAVDRSDRNERDPGSRVERVIKAIKRFVVKIVSPNDELIPPHP